MVTHENDTVNKYSKELETANSYADIWQIVKDTVKTTLDRHRGGMMLFLDDLPLQLGAYHPVGTNNIVLNRTLVEIVKAFEKSKLAVNALVYNLLLHEYLHALGELSEDEVKRLVVVVAKKCFGVAHIAATIASQSPWVLLRDLSFGSVNAPKCLMEIVKDLEKTDKYIV
ncbi:hypothetical protein E2P42_02385 [Candidatus Bathyarchaeota archaeon]|nr:hypothetical protein E2P42_02385 [Candidatus Bathyarchaeota archaeon]